MYKIIRAFMGRLFFVSSFAGSLLMMTSPASSGEEIKSLALWKNQAGFFRSSDFSNEADFKENLKQYYKSVYSSPLLERFSGWIDRGSLESEYYSSFYDDLEDTVYGDFEEVSDGLFRVESVQESCYDLDYSSPVMETIVNDYKVTNYRQEEVDTWLTGPGSSVTRSICLKIDRVIEFKLDESGLISEESKSVVGSELTLKP